MYPEDDDDLMPNETPQDEVLEDQNIETAPVPDEPDTDDASGSETPIDDAPGLADLNDRYLRLAADFENHRKRTAREWSERVRSANAELLYELLDMVDNFQRAVDVEHKESAYATGVRLILQQLQSLLQKWGVKPMDVVGTTFDPSRHEALLHVESDTEAEGKVCQEIRRGYVLHDRVLRAAQVAVSKGKPETN
jgi:molecular chaperone GrpE